MVGRKADAIRVRYLIRKAAPILRQRAVYGGWIYLLNSAVKQIYGVVALCSQGHMVVIPPVAGPTPNPRHPRTEFLFYIGNRK